jgi:hypothetical protein
LAAFWTWLGGLPQPQASFIGTLSGSFLGLVALLLGALFNAHLNRRRDDKLRDTERRSLATALHAELAGIRDALQALANDLATKAPSPDEEIMVTDLAHFVRVFPKVVDKLGLLNADTIGAVITAHGTIDAYCEHLLLMGGRLGEGAPGERRLIFMPADKAQWIKKMCEARAKPVTAALFALEAERVIAP